VQSRVGEGRRERGREGGRVPRILSPPGLQAKAEKGKKKGRLVWYKG
jgi:hypothetical protein